MIATTATIRTSSHATALVEINPFSPLATCACSLEDGEFVGETEKFWCAGAKIVRLSIFRASSCTVLFDFRWYHSRADVAWAFNSRCSTVFTSILYSCLRRSTVAAKTDAPRYAGAKCVKSVYPMAG